MKKIIIPVDFSSYSENALRTAAFIAKKDTAELIVVHMLEFSHALISQSEVYVQEQAVFYLKLAEKKMKEFLNKSYLKDVIVTPIIKHYKIFSELKDIANEKEADLIVMGSHGVSGLKELFVGSNTEKVVRNSEVPVLVVKGAPVLAAFKNAVFACDFSKDDIIPYQKAKTLLNTLECTLQLLYVNSPYDKFKSTEEQQKLFSVFLEAAEEDTALLNEIISVSDYTVERGILQYANTHKTDLIIMATHGKKGLAHFMDGSISEDVANHATLPVLTIKM